MSPVHKTILIGGGVWNGFNLPPMHTDGAAASASQPYLPTYSLQLNVCVMKPYWRLSIRSPGYNIAVRGLQVVLCCESAPVECLRRAGLSWVFKRNRGRRGRDPERARLALWLETLLSLRSSSVHCFSSNSPPEMHLTGLLCAPDMAPHRNSPTTQWRIAASDTSPGATSSGDTGRVGRGMEPVLYLLAVALARVCMGLGYSESSVQTGQRAASRHR